MQGHLKRQEVIKAVVRTLFNQLIIGLGLTVVIYHLSVPNFGIWSLRIKSDSLTINVPSFYIVLRDAVVTYYLNELTFYIIHVVMHSKPVYKYVHKVHHEWSHPISVASIYNHPLEFVTAGFIPVIAGPIVMGSHISTLWMILAGASVIVISEHSGYYFPIFKNAKYHYYHHSHLSENLGSYGHLDYIFGTGVKSPESKKKFDDQISQICEWIYETSELMICNTRIYL